MKRSIIFFLCVVFVLLLVSFPRPGYSIRKDTKLILDQLQQLERIIKDLEAKITTISTETNSMSQRISTIEEKLNAVTRSQADISQNKENLLLSLQFIKEEINELKNHVSKINDRLLSLPTAAAPTDIGSGAEETNEQTTQQSPETVYYAAYSDYIKKNYQLAIQGFRQFIQLFPQNGLADNSLYWVGECYYSQKMYQEAVNTFSELINDYSDGDKIPDAILKKGFALIEMGKQSEGISVLKGLISRFPLSEEASLAQQKIKEVME
ncbi:MAG: tol-pal system protein YbgF [Candidatus Aminicenantes bacterium]|nr:MAG: tol-pal system protein YbgF [Candidatus Aminicenantes bacterium]